MIRRSRSPRRRSPRRRSPPRRFEGWQNYFFLLCGEGVFCILSFPTHRSEDPVLLLAGMYQHVHIFSTICLLQMKGLFFFLGCFFFNVYLLMAFLDAPLPAATRNPHPPSEDRGFRAIDCLISNIFRWFTVLGMTLLPVVAPALLPLILHEAVPPTPHLPHRYSFPIPRFLSAKKTIIFRRLH